MKKHGLYLSCSRTPKQFYMAYVGLVTMYNNGIKLWSESTTIIRMNEIEALRDASNLRSKIILKQNQEVA